jgi:hypothetical protein
VLIQYNTGDDTRCPRKYHTICGLLTHGILAFTPEALPLGLIT